MNEILTLILFPLVASLVIYVIRDDTIRDWIVRLCAFITVVLAIFVVVRYFKNGIIFKFPNEELIDYAIITIEIILALYVITTGIINKKYIVSIFSIIQTPLMIWFELTEKRGIEVESSIMLDKLTVIMLLIIGVIGSLICVYAISYLKSYHQHHTEYKDRKNYFIAMLFLFLSAMFGLVLSNNLTWLYFCWELTTLCSYFLIGYTKTEEAKNNSFRALAINLGGGLAFAVAIVIIGINFKTLELSEFIHMKPTLSVLIPVFLLSMAALTKSAQIPFSSWLLGAMVAPTPSSALLHSATMVKAGVYLLVRLSPLMGQNFVGQIVTYIGAITFFVSALNAITQSDGKKILAYSTISNLGLIVMCASIGTQESLWAAILLMIFHANAKSLLFLSVGSVEHQIGSRNVEDMDILMNISRRLCLCMMIGIAGMFLAPFGMLISKWVAMKAFIDSKNIIVVIILAYGASATMFYWTKWMGKLASKANSHKKVKHKINLDEEIPIYIYAGLVVISCFGFPIISKYALVPYLSQRFGVQATIPIENGDIALMLIMLSMIVLLPLSFIPIYKKSKRRTIPVYMAGVNLGDNENFAAPITGKREMELSNWYMKGIFNNKVLTLWSNVICMFLICLGVILFIGGIAG